MNRRRWGARPLPKGQWEPIFPPGWGLQVLYAGLFCIGFLFSSPFLIHKNPLKHVNKGFTGTKDKRAYYGLVASQKVELRKDISVGLGVGGEYLWHWKEQQEWGVGMRGNKAQCHTKLVSDPTISNASYFCHELAKWGLEMAVSCSKGKFIM